MVSPIKKQNSENAHASDHMANERTYLAWIRTSIGIMAFGFVVERFALFIHRIDLLIGNQQLPVIPSSLHQHSSLIGLLIVSIGLLLALFSFINFKNVQKQIKEEAFHPSDVLNTILIAMVILIGVFLLTYLYKT
jgi:uncharacterized membrane protein YidH (DUF202 family)